MGEVTIRSIQAQRNLLVWRQRVAECRSSGLSVKRWCEEHEIKPQTYFNWQKKVFAVMGEQERMGLEMPREPEMRFVELPAPGNRNELVATVRIGKATLDVYSGANAEVVAVLCRVLGDAQ